MQCFIRSFLRCLSFCKAFLLRFLSFCEALGAKGFPLQVGLQGQEPIPSPPADPFTPGSFHFFALSPEDVKRHHDAILTFLGSLWVPWGLFPRVHGTQDVGGATKLGLSPRC